MNKVIKKIKIINGNNGIVSNFLNFLIVLNFFLLLINNDNSINKNDTFVVKLEIKQRINTIIAQFFEVT